MPKIRHRNERSDGFDVNDKDPIEEHKEWISHQYDPGHYTGGTIPHWLTKRQNKKPLAWVIFLFGLFLVALAIKDFAGDASTLEAFVYLVLGLTWVILALKTLFRKKSPL